MTLLVIVVWPKIRRVQSGEKVVMSRLLGAARGFSNSSPTPTLAAGEPESKVSLAGQNATAQIRNRITVNRDDPMPKEVETGILAMEELFRGVTNEWYVLFGGCTHSLSQHQWNQLTHIDDIFYSSFHSGEGRSPSLEDWQRMRTDVANLHNQLDQLDFAWTEDDQKESNATTTIINGDAGETAL